MSALEHVRRRSRGGPLDRSLRITVNLHPDRLTLDGEPLLRALARDARYRSQFETGTSNGGLTAHPGGDRWRWESRLFGGWYDDRAPHERPVYGALDHRRRALGGAPRFGSAFLRLREPVLDRSSFCYPDSWLDPVDLGTADRFDLLRLVDDAQRLGDDDPLDGYVEAHVHGGLSLPVDVEALVLDPCFRGTDVEQDAAALGVPLAWHEGRVLTLAQARAHRGYRPDEALDVAADIARHGHLDARVVGDAARSGRYPTQALKQVWHLIALFGRPGGADEGAH